MYIHLKVKHFENKKYTYAYSLFIRLWRWTPNAYLMKVKITLPKFSTSK